MMPIPTVYVVDDDEQVRDALRIIIHYADMNVETFSCGEDFLAEVSGERPGCLVLDLNLPDMDGLGVQARLAHADIELPIIMLTGNGDVPAAVQALQSGAVDFLQKPVDGDLLLERIRRAIDKDLDRRQREHERAAILDRIEKLTGRERQVMEHIVAGKASKVVAIELGISERTVEAHRAKVMQKMQAKSLAELIRLFLSVEP